MHVLSTITSPTSFEVIIVYLDKDFRGVQSPKLPPVRCMSQADKVMESSHHCAQLRALRGVHNVRDFRLVLRADVLDRVGEYPVQVLEESVAATKAMGVFDDYFPEPLIIYNPRKS